MGQAHHRQEMTAPDEVQIFHKMAGTSHVFTSPDLPGFHIGHPDLARAFEMIPEAISGLVEARFHVHADYKTSITLDEFEKRKEIDFSPFSPDLLAIIDKHAA